MDMAITMVVTVLVGITGGANSLGDTQITNSYSIPGFGTIGACENAKGIEVERMRKIVAGGRGGPRVLAECVAYKAK